MLPERMSRSATTSQFSPNNENGGKLGEYGNEVWSGLQNDIKAFIPTIFPMLFTIKKPYWLSLKYLSHFLPCLKKRQSTVSTRNILARLAA